MSQHQAWVFHGSPSVRVRDTYVRDVAGPLLARGADGVVKLDLVLRGLAQVVPGGAGGLVPSEVSWAELHDMCRGLGSHLATETHLKQRWVSDKLATLEVLGLIRRKQMRGGRSELQVLSDRGDLAPFDDPGSAGDHYVTLLGPLVRHDQLGGWNSAALTAYFAAMNAERYARADLRFATAEGLDAAPPGAGRWMRPLSWFSDPRVSNGPDSSQGRPEGHVRYPFNVRTLRRGIKQLVEMSFVTVRSAELDPRTGEPFKSGYPRQIYYNAFHLGGADRAHRASYLAAVANAAAPRRSTTRSLLLRPQLAPRESEPSSDAEAASAELV